MKTYIIYDTRDGAILHKHRLTSLDDGDIEDTKECSPEEVLSSFRRDGVPDEYLGWPSSSTTSREARADGARSTTRKPHEWSTKSPRRTGPSTGPLNVRPAVFDR